MEKNNVTDNPNLFLVGEPKTASTSMYHYLKQHPDIFMPEVKEPDYYAKDLQREYEKRWCKYIYPGEFNYKSFDDYKALYRNHDKTYAGDASVRYTISDEAIQRIYEDNPEAKIIYNVREPADWLISLFNHLKKQGEETASSIQEALELEKQRKNGDMIPFTCKTPSGLHYSEHIRFDKHLEKILSLFPRENVRVVVFERFKSNNHKVMQEIFDFLDLERIDVDPVMKNVGHRRLMPRTFKFIQHSRMWKIPKTFLPTSIYNLLSSNFKKIFRKPQNEPDRQVKKNLREKYFHVVKQLNELTEKNLLQIWHYEEERIEG